MVSNIMNEDLRSIKTKRSLYTAMFSLLKNLCFKKITIKEICEEALISRATFYTHFIDKYDLLKHWITELWPIDFDSADTYEQIESSINSQLYKNTLVLNNLFHDADNETIDILFDFIASTINLSAKKGSSEEIYSKNIVLSNFYAGGIITYLLWQVRNKFPSEVPPMNRYLYDMIHELRNWQSNKDNIGDRCK